MLLYNILNLRVLNLMKFLRTLNISQDTFPAARLIYKRDEIRIYSKHAGDISISHAFHDVKGDREARGQRGRGRDVRSSLSEFRLSWKDRRNSPV